MGVRAVVFEGSGEQPWRFRLVALGNNEVLAQSEGYLARQSAEETAYLILGPEGEVEVLDEAPEAVPMRTASGESRLYHSD